MAQLLGSAFENGPPRRPWSYSDRARRPGRGHPRWRGLYADVVNDFLTVDASPVLMRADERRAQWRPDGPGTLAVQIAYAGALPPDGIAAPHFTYGEPPVPVWDALAWPAPHATGTW